MKKSIFVSGYRSYELGVFDDKDPKLFYIKEFLKSRLIAYLNEGVEWVVSSGQLGIELWIMEVVIDLQDEYPQLKYSLLLPHLGFGESWNEANQLLFSKVSQQADYLNYTSNQAYKHPGQLRANQDFILKHTDLLLLVYDHEYEGKPKYLLEQAQSRENLEIEQVSMDELESFVRDYQEFSHGEFE